MVDGEEFVDGTNVDVRRLAGTLIGGILISYFAGWWRFIETLAGLAGELVRRPVFAVTELAAFAFSIPGNMIAYSYAVAGNWLAGPGAAMGPFVYVVAIVVTVLSLFILDTGLRYMGVFG